MFSRGNFEETQQMARKHGLAKNTRSSFKYLMKGKMNQSLKFLRCSQKQNRQSSVILSSVNKYAYPVKNSSIYQNRKETQIAIPLHENKNNLKQYQKRQDEPIKQIIDTSHDQIDFLKKFQKMSIERNVELKKSMDTDTQICKEKIKKEDLSITNEDKIISLQRQKVFLQNNLSEIIKQNQTLKLIIDNLTLNIEVINKQATEMQTENVNKIEYECQTNCLDKINFETQTQMSHQNIIKLQNQLCKAKECISNTFELCISLGSQDQEFIKEKWHNLKDAVCQCISSKIIGTTNQFQRQRLILEELNNQLKEQLKKITLKSQTQKQQNLRSIQFINQLYNDKQQQLQRKINQNQQRCRTIQKELSEKIEYFNKTIADNEKKYNEQKLQANSIRRDQLQNHEKEIKLIKQLMENNKRGWQEKQKLYSNLLLEAHKTINNLMIQMKQFESQANYNYSKNLKVQRTLTGIQSSNNSP